MTITDEQKQIVKSTAPILKENGKEITSIFYSQIFKAHPDLLNIFNQTNQKIGTQPLALANTIYLAAENIDHLDVLIPQVRMIAHKHRALIVQPQHYKIVGEYLLKAIAEFLGDKATPVILDAWSAAYNVIASVFIDVEEKMYADLGEDERNRDFIPFKILKKESIASGPIVALTLERSDGGQIIGYHPGQYLTLRVKKDGFFHNRHYSLTHLFDGKTYRVAIKQEKDHEPFGVVSNQIMQNYAAGDTILASLPAGDFALVKDAKNYLFIAGGIGITALAAMIQDLSTQGKSDLITLIHCVPTEAHAAFADRMRSLLRSDRYRILHHNNRLSKEILQSKLNPDTQVYLCGSVSFMDAVRRQLAVCGHPESQVHLEVFQPTLSLVKDAAKDQSTTHAL